MINSYFFYEILHNILYSSAVSWYLSRSCTCPGSRPTPTSSSGIQFSTTLEGAGFQGVQLWYRMCTFPGSKPTPTSSSCIQFSIGVPQVVPTTLKGVGFQGFQLWYRMCTFTGSKPSPTTSSGREQHGVPQERPTTLKGSPCRILGGPIMILHWRNKISGDILPYLSCLARCPYNCASGRTVLTVTQGYKRTGAHIRRWVVGTGEG